MSKLEWEVLSVKNEYYIPKERKKELQWFCKQYKQWQEMVASINLVKRAYYKETKGKNLPDYTSELAIQLERYTTKINIVRKAMDETTKNPRFKDALTCCIIDGYGREKVCAIYDISEYEFRKAYNEFFWRLDKIRG